MVQCEICSVEYREGELELHRKMCAVVRMMFRCSLCYEDFLSQEAVWNHLDLHEIPGESKESHYQEVKAKHQSHQPVLGYDQQGCLQSPDWKPIQDVPKSTILSRFDHEQQFQIERFKVEHVSSHFPPEDRLVTSSIHAMEEEQAIERVENMICESELIEPLREEFSINPNEGPDTRINEHLHSSGNQMLPLQFPCDICGKPFLSKRLSVRHKKSCEKKKVLALKNAANEIDTKCSHCGKECYSARNLQKHTGQVHAPLECNICGIVFEGYHKLYYHKKSTHGKAIYKCDECSLEFRDLKHYESHVCSFVRSDLTSSFENSDERILEIKSDPDDVLESPSDDPASSIKCFHCGMGASSADALTRHILLQHDPVACDFCGITLFGLSATQIHVKTSHRKSKVKCPHCSKQFSHFARLRIHISICDSSRVPCSVCGRVFQNATAAKKHTAYKCLANKNSKKYRMLYGEPDIGAEVADLSAESEAPQTKCYYCDEDFSGPGYLIHHLQVRHKLTKCDICGITVFGLSSAKNHKLKFHAETRYECSICGEKFVRKKDYNTHCFLCGNKANHCRVCGRTFQTFLSMKLHYERHHPEETIPAIPQNDQNLKQNQSYDLKMEITEDEPAGPADDDRGQITNPRRDSDSCVNSIDDGNKDLPMVSIPSLNSSSETEVVSEKTSQPGSGSPSSKIHSCEICGMTLPSYNKLYYHKRTFHTYKGLQCAHCSRSFHTNSEVVEHELRCADLTNLCMFCGKKYDSLGQLEKHKNRFHRGEKPTKMSNTERSNRTSQERNACSACKISFASIEDLTNHKIKCPAQSGEHDNSLIDLAETSAVKEANRSTTVAPQAENIDLKLDIKVEDTSLEDEEYPVANKEPGISNATTSIAKRKKKCFDSLRWTEPKVVMAENSSNEANGTKCSYCGTEESSADSLTSHVLFNHDPVACDLCGITMSNYSEARQHLNIAHNEANVKCPHCSLRINWRHRLQTHIANCEKEQTLCDFCGKAFQNESHISDHMRTRCAEYRNRKKQEPNSLTLSPRETKCYYCKEVFPSRGRFIHHMKVHHELTKCEVCEMTVLGISSIRHHKMDNHKVPKYECPLCKRKFHHQIKYNRHKCRGEPEKEKPVNSVQRVYRRYIKGESGLKNVLATATTSGDGQGQPTDDANVIQNTESFDGQHSIEKEPSKVSPEENTQSLATFVPYYQYTCNLCDYVTSNYNAFHYHRMTRHTEGKFKCPHCARHFHHKRKFTKHLACCERLRVSCDLCGQRFNMATRLKHHMEIFHKDKEPSGDVNMEGAESNKKRKRRSAKKSDETQKPTVCRICRATFVGAKDLKEHKKTCSSHGKGQKKAQPGTHGVQLLKSVKKEPNESMIIPQIKLEFTAEEPTMQQGQQHPEAPLRSVATAMPSHCDESNSAGAAADDYLEFEIEMDQEHSEDEQ